MFEKRKLKKQLVEKEKQIQIIEQKRMRSQSAIVEAILAHEDPSDEDTDYFNEYSAQIKQLRDELRELIQALGE